MRLAPADDSPSSSSSPASSVVQSAFISTSLTMLHAMWDSSLGDFSYDQFGLAGLRADRVNGLCWICERFFFFFFFLKTLLKSASIQTVLILYYVILVL
jgi:hypothetical protein